MREVAVLGVGMHRFGKTGDDIVGNKSVGALCRHAVDAALSDAGVSWKQIEAVSERLHVMERAREGRHRHCFERSPAIAVLPDRSAMDLAQDLAPLLQQHPRRNQAEGPAPAAVCLAARRASRRPG